MRRMMSAKKGSMKMMSRKMKRVSKTGKRASVFRGTKEKTVGGLTKAFLKKNKAGKIVSKKASDAAKKRKGFKKIVAWGTAFKAARKALGIKGFVACGGKTAQGKALLAKTRSFYKK